MALAIAKSASTLAFTLCVGREGQKQVPILAAVEGDDNDKLGLLLRGQNVIGHGCF